MFKDMQKSGVKKAKPEHYAQMQIYMKWSIDQFGEDGCRRALYFVVNKDNDDIYTERLEYNKQEAQALVDKAMAVITAPEPPVGVSTDPTWFECKFCDYQAICHGTDVPIPTCRSCVHATPELGGNAVWSCASHSTVLSEKMQRKGCNDHRFIPILLAKTGHPVDLDQSDNVIYKMADGKQFINGDPDKNFDHISSAEIHACADKTALVDEFALDLRKQHNARFV
jgi:hypothetical protein